TIKAMPNPMNQWNGVRFLSVRSPILSETVAKVWSPSTIGGWILSWISFKLCIFLRFLIGLTCYLLVSVLARFPLVFRLLLKYGCGVVRHLRIRILQIRHVCRSRLRVQLVEQVIVTLVLLDLCDLALRIVLVAENDSVGRACRLARGHHFPVTDLPAVLFSLDPRLRNAMRTVGAFFHHTAAAYRNLGIPHKLVLRRIP